MSYSASVTADLGSGEVAIHSVMDRKPAERKYGFLDPMEELSQLAEEGQRRRDCREKGRLLSV